MEDQPVQGAQSSFTIFWSNASFIQAECVLIDFPLISAYYWGCLGIPNSSVVSCLVSITAEQTNQL